MQHQAHKREEKQRITKQSQQPEKAKEVHSIIHESQALAKNSPGHGASPLVVAISVNGKTHHNSEITPNLCNFDGQELVCEVQVIVTPFERVNITAWVSSLFFF